MDSLDLDIFNERLPQIKYREDRVLTGDIVSVIINDYGTMFELDSYKPKILSSNKLRLQIGQRVVISIYRGIYQRRDRNYQQSYLHSINRMSLIDVVQNGLSDTLGYAS